MTKKELLESYEEQKRVYLEKEKPKKEKDILQKYGNDLGCLLISLCFSDLINEDKLRLVEIVNLELKLDKPSIRENY